MHAILFLQPKYFKVNSWWPVKVTLYKKPPPSLFCTYIYILRLNNFLHPNNLFLHTNIFFHPNIFLHRNNYFAPYYFSRYLKLIRSGTACLEKIKDYQTNIFMLLGITNLDIGLWETNERTWKRSYVKKEIAWRYPCWCIWEILYFL